MPGRYEVDVEEIEYLRHGDKPLLARVFKPRGKGPFPAVLEAHGGAWVQSSRVTNDPINMPVATGGVVVAALDFRCPPEATYPGSVADINYAVRWLKSNAERFNTRPEMIGTMGTSSGGHLAVLVAMKPGDPRYAAIPLKAARQFDARVPFVVTLWPVICPLGRRKDRVAGQLPAASTQEQYWLTEEAMAEGSPNLALQRGDKTELPDILYVQHPADPMHPRANLDSFVSGYRKAGGQLQLEFFEGDKYDAVRSDPGSAASKAVVSKIVDFIQRHGCPPSTIKAAPVTYDASSEASQRIG